MALRCGIDREANHIYEGGEPDFEVTQDVMHYIIIDSNLISSGDPVFGEQQHIEFERLLKSIDQSMIASRT